MFDPHRFHARLHEVGITRSYLQPSAMQQSSYDYVYVALDDSYPPENDTDRCPHLVISDAAEYGEDGVLAGRYETMVDDGELHSVDSEDAAFDWVKQQVSA